MSVKVGVRVRPFNKRQQQMNSKLCVQMQGSTTTAHDSDGLKKSFNFDYSFWSHDGFEVDQNGYSRPTNDKYADQTKVYQLIGSSILVNAWEGYNCCLFAYGQTGSGKSYSMIGYGANKGLIPIVCNSIFEKINNNSDGTRSFEVKISMLEIYNEQVKDLLSKNKKTELKICEHKTLGVYVQGLEKHSVNSYEKIQKKIEEGSNNRSIAATLMNESSSRSHTIVSINFVQKIQISMEQTSVKYSMIHLVDLAGSQCVAKTGVDSKDRLRQTSKINQSLTSLGRVIQILAQNCNKKEKDKTFVPYRDSKLTFILRNALGGNSCTAMICAISPADDNFEQTVSTLRYASRAKKIQNKAIVNESDVDKLIRVLRQQNQMLKKMLQQARTNKTQINQEMISNFNETKNMVNLAVQGNKESSRNEGQQQKLLEDLENDSINNSINDSYALIPFNSSINESLPYLTNISEDQLLSFRIKYSCERLNIGTKKGNPKPDIILRSLGIQSNHAFISYDNQNKKCYLQLLQENAVNYTFVNGQTINPKSKQEIFHLDRIIFGTGCLFILIFKDSKPRNQTLKIQDIDYQFAMNQMQISSIEKTIGSSPANDEKNIRQQQQLRKKIVSQIQEQFLSAKKHKQQQLKKQFQQKEHQYFHKIKELQQIKQKQSQKLINQLKIKQEESERLEIQKFKIKEEVDKLLKQSKLIEMRQESQKKKLEETKNMLEAKERQIYELQNRMNEIKVKTQEKQVQFKEEIKKQEVQMKRQLEIQTTLCHNANIIDEYLLQLNKRLKNAKELKDLLAKKQKIQLQKILVDLVPLVQRFNLMAKEMNKRVQCGLSIEYKYISQAQIIDVLKNNTYKSKLRILIHVINRDQGRSYYWNSDIFKNRYEHALEYFDSFIKSSKSFKYNRQQDPYWDPEKFQTVAYTHLTFEFLMFNISYEGELSIISHGKKIGRIYAKLYQTDKSGKENLSIDQKGQNGTFKLINPHDQAQKTIYFMLQLSHIQIVEGNMNDYDKMRFQYTLLENYKVIRYQSDVILKDFITDYKYSKLHCFKELSENNIIHFLQNPISIDIQIVQKIFASDQLTHRSSASGASIVKSSFARQIEEGSDNYNNKEMMQITQFKEISPPKKPFVSPARVESSSTRSSEVSAIRSPRSGGVIYENTLITKKVEQQYNRKKNEENAFSPEQINMKKKKQVNESFVAQKKNGSDAKKKDKNGKECEIY